ncbi:MAG: DoxX family membrane protein, partial [Acidobacteriota bacterium]
NKMRKPTSNQVGLLSFTYSGGGLAALGGSPRHRAIRKRMEPQISYGRAWALFFAREVLGLIFFMAGVFKVFELGPVEHARKYFLPYSDTFLPVWSLWAVGVVVPVVELLAGGLLILGWRTRAALLLLGSVLVVVTFGHLLKEPLYPFHQHVMPRLVLLLFVLMFPRQEDRFSLDALLRRRAEARKTAGK